MKKLEPRDGNNRALVQGIVDRIKADWLREPNIAEVGVGIKISNGRPQIDTLAVQFHVRKKLPAEELLQRGWRQVPDQIDDVPTDVEAIDAAPLVLDTRSQRFDPILGGVTIGNTKRNSVGTLGGFVFSNVDARALGLTNEHVLVFSGDGATGDEVAQPASGYDSDVRIVDAECCPDGQLTFRSVPNPLSDTLADLAAVAAIAAVASDEIDPHRRGQLATNVDPGEQTRTERVRMKVGYREVPLPGTAYRANVEWEYERITDRRVLTHAVKEVKQNPHTLNEQELLTDHKIYRRGQLVRFLAALGAGHRRKPCDNFHVVAHALPPSGAAARRTILRPLQPSDYSLLREGFSELDPKRPIAPYCLHFSALKPGTPVGRAFRHLGAAVASLGPQDLAIVDQIPRGGRDGNGELRFPDAGVRITLPVAAERVVALVASFTGRQVTLRAFDGTTEVGSRTGSHGPQGDVLEIQASRITNVVVQGGGGEGVLLIICSYRVLETPVCLYTGTMLLRPTEELGIWSTYVVAQTLNDVPAGTDPAIAAQTIGGLAVTNNLTSGGRFSQLGYGEMCALDAVPDGSFVVVPVPPTEVLK
jgi:hypothetical protein